ncbi:MAG: DUF366 family protein [Euryarchaeota archaeon]|nr:DUF366 family protein [Euryarchaeota archaeon]
MRVLVLEEWLDYTGRELESLWAYVRFGIDEDSIVAFRGGCEVAEEHMVDLEDRLGGERIHSQEMLHFIVEHFGVSLAEIFCRQRLLTCIACERLRELGVAAERRGDDIYCGGEKLSVSIASVSAVSGKVHLGINVRSDEYMSLEKLGVEAAPLLRAIAEGYAGEVEDMERKMRRVRALGCFNG